MASQVGVVRDGEGLARALYVIAQIEKSASPALRNMAVTALLVAAAAWKRRESRGAHFRTDFPQASLEWQHSIIFVKPYNG